MNRLIFSAVLFFIMSWYLFSQQPNMISADPYAGKDIGGIKGIVLGPTNSLLKGTVVIITDQYITTILGEMVSYGIRAEYQIGFLPANTTLQLFAYHDSIPNSIFHKKFQLDPGDVREINIHLPMPGSVILPGNMAEVILRGQYTDYVSGMKDLLKQIKESSNPSPLMIYDASDFLLTAWPDIGKFTFTEEQGQDMNMYAICGLGSDPVAFNRTFKDNGSLKNFNQRKEIYKAVLYEIAFQDELGNLNMIEAYNGNRTDDDLLTAVNNIFQDVGRYSEVAVAVAEFLSEENLRLLEYTAGTNQFNDFLNELKKAGRHIRHGSLDNFSKVLEGVSVATGTIQFIKSGWVVTNTALLLKSAQFDLGVLRLEELAKSSTISDNAFRQAISEVISELKNPPEEPWDKVLESIRQNKDAVNEGIFGLANALAKSIGITVGTKVAYSLSGWLSAGIFAIETYKMIQTFEENLQSASAAATIYGNLIENKPNNVTYQLADIIEYSEIAFYSRMMKLLKNRYMQFFALWRPSQREVTNYLEKEYIKLLKNVAKKRLYWFKSTFDGNPDKPITASDIAIGFIIDSSGSMTDSDPNDIRKSATEQIIDQLSGNENLFLVDFDASGNWLNQASWDNWDREEIKTSVRRIDSNGGTNVGLGINTLRNALEQNITDFSKTAVVLLTDGMGNYSGEAEWFAQNGIKIFTVSYKDRADANLMESIASQTGGIYIQADNESEVVSAFMQFNNYLQGMSKFASYRGSFNGQSTISLPSFYVDPACSDMTVSLNYSGSNKDFSLISPSGLTYSSSYPSPIAVADQVLLNYLNQSFPAFEQYNITHGPYSLYEPSLILEDEVLPYTNIEWVKGENYIMAKILSPEPGEWKAELRTQGSVPSNDSFLFEAMGEPGIDIEMKATRTGSTYIYTLEESAPGLLWDKAEASVLLKTPDGSEMDISRNYNQGRIHFYPAYGKGNYQVDISLRVNDAHNHIYQRHFMRSELVGEVLPGYIALVKEVMGMFIVTDQGTFTGNRPGIKCIIYPAGGSPESPRASGYVTHVNERECTIRVTDIRMGKIEPGDIVQLDMLQWQNDVKE